MRYISPMRLAPVLALLAATPLHAWEFSATAICTLTHATQETTVRVTYDPRIPEYAIALTRTAAGFVTLNNQNAKWTKIQFYKLLI